MANFLDNLKVGDEVIVRLESSLSSSDYVSTVRETSKTTITLTDSSKWNRNSGRRRGSDGWNYSHLEEATPEKVQEVKEEFNRRLHLGRLESMLKTYKFPADVLLQMYDIARVWMRVQKSKEVPVSNTFPKSPSDIGD